MQSVTEENDCAYRAVMIDRPLKQREIPTSSVNRRAYGNGVVSTEGNSVGNSYSFATSKRYVRPITYVYSSQGKHEFKA